jgi:hypothetical protein
MMKLIQNQNFDAERAFYDVENTRVENCTFDGPADGESAFKECRNIEVSGCYFNLRYPFWHDVCAKIEKSEMTSLCRAPLWYSHEIEIIDSKLHGTKALRECADVSITDCDIISAEFGWMVSGIEMKNTSAAGEYFMMRSEGLRFTGVKLTGKYSFQYITNSYFEDCNFDTKDALWHAKNVVLSNCTIKGEYLGWYCEDVTFINCKIIGTQPLCYCKGLKLVNCKMVDCDLAFERSEVEADIHSHVVSIKNVTSGLVTVDSVGEVIVDEPFAQGTVIVRL